MPKESFWILSAGIYFFLPVIIDKIEQRLSHFKRPKIVWSRYLATLFIIFFFLIAADIVARDLGIIEEEEFCPIIENEEVKECIEKVKTSKGECHGIDLQLDKVKEKVKGNKKALELFKDNCLWLLDAQFHDLTGDQKEELMMIAAGAGCTSYHIQTIYILKDDKVIFEKDAEDIWFWPAEDYYGFAIKHPLRQVGEAYCCPTEGIVESYQVWEGDNYKYFHKFDSHCEKYELTDEF